jgi:carbamoyl-phosphate synthase small subunit
MDKIYIYLENGVFLEANSFGAKGTSVGEIVFNTSMTGYQEIITDPSYAGQFITFSATEIGNVGVNEDDNESRGIYTKGVIVKNYQKRFSNFRGEKSLDEFLKEKNILGICNIDTRFLTQTIRDEGAMMMVASTKISNKEELKKILNNSPKIQEINYIKEVGTTKAYVHSQAAWNDDALQYKKPKSSKKKILAIDFGAKLNILNELVEAGLEVEVVPHFITSKEIITRFKNKEIKGVFLSNGPGDPLILKNEQKMIKDLIDENIPMFGICLGHQLLSIAHGYSTYKMKFGHHGGNQPVLSSLTNQVEITAQNHNYSVPQHITEIAEVTHRNLFDNTIEGVKYKNRPIFSVQYHPESSPGPHESKYLFNEFAKIIS